MMETNFDDLIPEKQDASIDFYLWLSRCYNDWVATGIGRGRNAKDLSQKAFGEWIGVDANTISQYITGKREPTGKYVDLLANKLGAEVYDRLGIPRRIPKNKITYFVMDNLRYLDENEIKELIERIKTAKLERAGLRVRMQVQEENDHPRLV